jgi:hypothetical protein
MLSDVHDRDGFPRGVHGMRLMHVGSKSRMNESVAANPYSSIDRSRINTREDGYQ